MPQKLQEVYRDFLDGETSKSSEEINISPPEICTNFLQMENDSTFNVSDHVGPSQY